MATYGCSNRLRLRGLTSAAVSETCQRSTLLAFASSQTRGYAIKAPKSWPKANPQIFNLSGITLPVFDSIVTRNGQAFKRLKPAGYFACLQKFHDAVQRGSNPWTLTIAGSKDGFPLEVVHETACILRQVQYSKNADAYTMIMWASASEAGFRPSTLSLARQLIRGGAYGKMPQLKKVEARFKNLVSTFKDPDALTVEGELQFEQGHFEAAIRTLERALRVGEAGSEAGDEASDFEWKPYCRLCLAKAYQRVGRGDEAKDLLVSLSEAGLIEAGIELGHMLKTSDGDEAEKYLYSAACHGRPDGFNELVEISTRRAADDGLDEQTRAEATLWAKEWSKLADPKVEY